MRMSTKFTIVLALAIALVLVALGIAYYKGRNSRSWEWVSTVVAPVSERLYRETPNDITLPYANPAGQLEAGWRWLNPQQVDVEPAPGAFSMFAATESLWFLNTQGPMVYRHLVGDATVAASVKARKRSARESPPDMEWQFAGLMLRDPAGGAWMSRENYVFNVIGFCCGELQVETKSTVNGKSHIHSMRWDGSDADLSIERKGSTFTMRARRSADDAWQELVKFDRPDLPERLQVGLIAYAHSEGRGRHDLQASFNHISVR
jgi:hypothetical protein